MNPREFQASAADFGIPLNAESLGRFQDYERELLAWNRRMNLIAKGDEPNLWSRHFLDSLIGWSSCRSLISEPFSLAPALIDIGTGGGFPGLAIKIAWPEVRLALVESVRKKTLFLKHLVETLSLKDVQVFCARAEALAKDPLHRGQYDVALARAVGSIEELKKLSAPLLKGFGLLIAWRSGKEETEIPAQGFPAYRLPGETRERRILVLPRGRLTRPGELG